MAPDHPLEQLYLQLSSTFDFHQPTRSEWRSLCFGADREPMQRLLIGLASGARAGTQADRLAIYKAAHAVLPLEGSELLALAEMLMTDRPVPLEWCDVLVDALAMSDKHFTIAGTVLEALGEACARAATTPDQRRARMVCAHISALGYRPAWLTPASPQESDPTPVEALNEDEVPESDEEPASTPPVDASAQVADDHPSREANEGAVP